MKFYDYDDNNVLQTVAETTIIWDSANEPTNYKWSQILYDIRRADANQNLFLEPITEKEILDYYADQILTFDALVVQNNQLEKEMKIFERLMNNVGENLKVSAMQQTTPFTKNGVANVCNIFELSDGQTITIFFHSPDTTPKKITPTDNLISYKWVLNKKDITIVVAPERGKDLNVREVCRRIMKLAEKNSAAFARANKNRAEKAQKLADTENEIAQLEKQLADLQQQLEIAKVKRDELQIKLAEQSKNDFRDDSVKVSIKNNEKLQDVNNVQPDDENLNGGNYLDLYKLELSKNEDIISEAKSTNFSKFMKYYNNNVIYLLEKKLVDAEYGSLEQEFLTKILYDDNLRENTFKGFGEEIYRKYNNAESKAANIRNAENILNEKLSQYSSLNESSLKFWVMQGMGSTNRDTPNKDTKAFLNSFHDVPSLLNSILQKIKESDKITFSTVPYYDDKQYFACFYNKDKMILKMSGASYHSGLEYVLYSIFEPYFAENGGLDFTSEKAYEIVEKYFKNYIENNESVKNKVDNTENNTENLVENNAENNVTEPQQIESENEIVIDAAAAEKLKNRLDFFKFSEDNLKDYIKSSLVRGDKETITKFLESFNDVPSLLNSILQIIKKSDSVQVAGGELFKNNSYKTVAIRFQTNNGWDIILEIEGRVGRKTILANALIPMFEPYLKNSKEYKEFGTEYFSSKEAYAIAEKYFQNYLSNK